MAHLAEGTLQSFLDDELPARDRAGAAEHLLVCGECRAGLDELKRVNGVLRDALADLDIPAPAAAPPAARRPPVALRGGSLAKAAVLVLMAAAAASAAVPGSPVREWIVQTVRPVESIPEQPIPTAPAVDAPPPAEAPAAPAGLAVPGARNVEVVVSGLEGAAIRLVRAETEGVAVSARGGSVDPTFRLASGRIEVVGGAGGELLVEVPRSGASVRLIVDGRRYADVVGGEIRTAKPGEREGEGVIWR